MSDATEPVLRSANDNPWYCLATLRGEQPVDRFDPELAEKNRLAWQQWFGDITDGERAQLAADFANRVGGRSLRPPEPSARPDFSHTRFERRVSFVSFRFYSSPDFSSATFCADADFSEVQAHSDQTDFGSATFIADVSFRSAIFGGSVNFRNVTFSGKTDFKNASLSYSCFDVAMFSRNAEFNPATFRGTASFASATFSRIANFGSAKFTGEAGFQAATFLRHASFRATTFHDVADFNSATFSSSIHFINAKFSGDTIFSHVSFEDRVPDFRGATMHEATEWHGVTWPNPPEDDAAAQQQVYAYERLKQEMERLKKHEDEQNFFRKELRARRGLVRTFSGGWLLNFIYQWSSGYGNSIYLPTLWLLGVFAAGVAIFTHMPLCAGQPMPLKLAARLSFANIFVFLPDKREIMTLSGMATCNSNWTAGVSAAQSLLGVLLLFLLGLALRNRYRMK